MIYKKKEIEKPKSYNELKQENQEMKKKIESLENKIGKLEKEINDFQHNCKIQPNIKNNIVSNTIIIKENEEDKIGEKINTLKKIIQNTKEKWNKILSEIISFEAEIKDIKNQMKINFENIKKEYYDVFKKTLQKQYDDKINQKLNKIYDMFNKKLEESIKKMEMGYKKQFEQLNNKNKDNVIQIEQNIINFAYQNVDNIIDKSGIKEDFSYECLNIEELCTKINEGDDIAKIKIILKNNGINVWPEGSTVLCFNREGKLSGDEIKLRPQKPGEEQSYDIILSSLQNKEPGEYPIIIEIYVYDNSIGEQINAKVIIEKNN